MGNVEDSSGITHGMHLSQDAGWVLNRHIPTTKRHHAATQRYMGAMESSFKVIFSQSIVTLADVPHVKNPRATGAERIIPAAWFWGKGSGMSVCYNLCQPATDR